VQLKFYVAANRLFKSDFLSIRAVFALSKVKVMFHPEAGHTSPEGE
jgi:hypothetical protein